MRAGLSLTAALGVFLLTASFAMAQDLPKTGAFIIHVAAKGSSHFVTLGKGESYLDVWEELGAADGEGLLSHMTTRCFGTGENFKGINETPHGHCVHRDADGDQIVYETGNEKHGQDRSVVKGWGRAILGTGKYEGIVASYVVTCERIGPYGGYTNDCEGRGSYILP